MAVTIKADVGASDANSYETLDEFKAYLANRLQLPASVTGLLTSDPNELLPKALIMATKHLDAILARRKRLEIAGGIRFYVLSSYWTGSPATTDQALAWPRKGMYDANGNPIPENVIPQGVKDAESEFAILALTTDLTADNQTITAGLTSLTAGPVSLEFKDYIQTRTLPTSVLLNLVAGWITEETYESALSAQFRTLGTR